MTAGISQSRPGEDNPVRVERPKLPLKAIFRMTAGTLLPAVGTYTIICKIVKIYGTTFVASGVAKRVAAIYNLSRRTEWFGRRLETMGREIADLSAEIGGIRLTILTMVRHKQTYRDAGNSGVRGGIRGGRGGRGPSGAPCRRSPHPPSDDIDGEETISKVNSFGDYQPPHVEAEPIAAHDGQDVRHHGVVFEEDDDQQRGDGDDHRWEGPFRVDIPKFDGEPHDEPLYDGPSILDEEPPGSEDFNVECNSLYSTNKDCDQPFGGESVHARGVGPAPIPDEDFSLHKLVDVIICMLHPEVKQSAIELAKAMENDDGVILTRHDKYFQVIDHSGGVEFFSFVMPEGGKTSDDDCQGYNSGGGTFGAALKATCHEDVSNENGSNSRANPAQSGENGVE
ncbi:UDP-Glycosyltransferase superfamily protein [Striga asiatica]|uniref:UDP-Glycosyltransferase superfamily protein n=1 Tax=Striga asiatica TaxID=4170 RepID=A0A5A7PEH5_STRAF|nr:UDP-Glycosyltransferase superfamily protein [Striga asiatica]